MVVSDLLPDAVSGSDLNATIAISKGKSVTYTIPATVADGDSLTVTNEAAISNTWQYETASADFIQPYNPTRI